MKFTICDEDKVFPYLIVDNLYSKKEQKLILQNLTKACESRNKAVHKIVNKSFKNAKTDTQKKVIPFKSLDKILEGKPPQH